MSETPLVDRAFLEKLERLAIFWQKSFSGLVGGHEFLDHRHFHHGDDLRAVNWRAYLRLERLFLKTFQIEPRVPVRVLLDVSRSMGTGGLAKFDCARKLVAALAYVGLVRLDTIAIHPFRGALGDRFLCSGGRHRFGPVADFLQQLTPEGGTDYLQVARQFLGQYSQRGLLVIISDFLSEGDCEKPLQYLSDFGHELFLVQVWAEEDRDPPWDGDLELEDAETGRRLELEFDSGARARYREGFDAWCVSVQRMALRGGGRYAGISTRTPVEEAIFGPLGLVWGL
jgi:uncharacterized protein (DUF58 family)